MPSFINSDVTKAEHYIGICSSIQNYFCEHKTTAEAYIFKRVISGHKLMSILRKNELNVIID